MAIVINGSGTLTGLAVGGLPDGTVDAGTVAADVATQAEIDAKLNLTGGTMTGQLTIDQNTNNIALTIDSESTGNWATVVTGAYGLRVEQDITSGRGAYFKRDLAEAGSNPLVEIVDTNTSNTQPALKVYQDGAAYGLEIDQNGNSRALYIDTSTTTSQGLLVNAGALTTGKAAQFYSNSADTGTRNLVEIWNDHASSSGTTALKIQQDGAGYGIEIDQNGNARALKIDCASTSYDAIKVHESKYGMQITQTISNGYAANFNRNLNESGNSPLVKITDDHVTNSQPALKIQQDGTGAGLEIDQNGTSGYGIKINQTSASAGLYIESNTSETNDLVNMLMLTSLSSGTTTTGFGSEIRFQAERNNGVNQNTGRISSVAEVNSGSNISSGLGFWTSAVGSISEKLRISWDGKVGIGTASPAKHLSVESTAAINTVIRSKGSYADGYRHGFEAVNAHTGGETWSIFSTNDADGVFGGGKLVFGRGDASVVTAARTGLTINNSMIVTTPHQPSFMWKGCSGSSCSTPGVNNSSIFVFGSEVFDTNNDCSSTRFTAPLAGVYHFDVHITHSGPGANTETRYMSVTFKLNGATKDEHSSLNAFEAVTDGWGSGNSYHVQAHSTNITMTGGDYVELVVARSSSSDWSGGVNSDRTRWSGYLIG